jgi:hypothetical protein
MYFLILFVSDMADANGADTGPINSVTLPIFLPESSQT